MKNKSKTKEYLQQNKNGVSTTKSTKGITLIALVITIIVLLILAGVTIAMLSGENGILDRATSTQAYNCLAEAKENILLKANENIELYYDEVYVQQKASGNYTFANLQTAAQAAVNGSGDLASYKATMPSHVTVVSATQIKYENGRQVATVDLTVGSDGKITFQPVAYNGGAGGGGQTPTASTVVFKDGETTVTSPQVGNDVEIGAEKFKVIKITGNKVTAMPYYNLDLTLPADQIKQQTSESNPREYEQTPQFSTVQEPTWHVSENITLGATESTITTPIENYETYLRDTLGASNVEAKIGRYFPTTQAGATITEAEYIGNLSGLNPSGEGDFWLGSSMDDYEESSRSYIMTVLEDGEAYSSGYTNDATYDYYYYFGVRPVIIITI